MPSSLLSLAGAAMAADTQPAAADQPPAAAATTTTPAIQASGKRLTTIYVSQSDPDYYFSLGPIKAAFPEARVLAAPAAVAAIQAADRTRGESLRDQQGGLYPRLAGSPEQAANLWEAARREREEGYLAEARSADEARDEADLAGGGYEQVALELMRALSGERPARLILNVPNAGTVTALDDAAVVETVCEVDAAGPRPLPAVPPGDGELGLMLQVKAVERATIRAALTGSYDAALRALTLHPLVDSPAVANRLLLRRLGE